MLEAATARIEAAKKGRAEYYAHERARAQGRAPDVALATAQHWRAQAQSGRERACEQLGRALSSEPLSPAERLEAARAAVDALPRQLAALVDSDGASPKRWRRKAGRSLADVAEAVRDALASRIVGPRHARGASGKYVQEEDLEDLIPDGWGTSFPLEISRLARRAGVPPLAVPLLSLLTWTSQCKDAVPGELRACGAGFQVSIAWLARKLGCSASWVKVLLNRLDPFAEWRRAVAGVRRSNARARREGREQLPEPKKPTGTPWVHRYRRLARYSELSKRDGSQAACWVDQRGRARFWCDVRGVVYVTDAGRGLLVRRARLADKPRPGVRPELRPNGCLNDLQARLARVRWRVRARLRRGSGEKAEPEFAGSPAG